MTAGKVDSKDLGWMKEHFHEGDAEKIKNAVIKAEQHTSGDIVPMMVHRSSNLTAVAPTIFLLIYVMVLLLGNRFFTDSLDWNFSIFALASAVVSVLAALVFSRIEAIQRLVIPAATLVHEVHTRAELEFYRNHFDQTKAHGAVLIFVSMMERRVVILRDEFLDKKIEQKRWDSVAELVSSHMKKRHVVEGLIAAIELCGQLLSQALPQDGRQSHEISTDFRIKE